MRLRNFSIHAEVILISLIFLVSCGRISQVISTASEASTANSSQLQRQNQSTDTSQPVATAVGQTNSHIPRDATAQSPPFGGSISIQQETCCVDGANGKTAQLHVFFSTYSNTATVTQMRIQTDAGKDCRSTDAPPPRTLDAPWEPIMQTRDYAVPVPQERWRILVQYRDAQGHIFPEPAACDDVVGLATQ